jgi:uncharacterized membrane protein YjjP (DUF1212 family)
MGVAANSVVSKALDITEAYCDQPVHINITFNLIMLSQIRGLEDEPLTLIRSVPMRDINNMTVQAVQQLIYEIRTGIHDLSSAEAALDHILTSPKSYPIWVPSIANACIAPAVVLMFSTDWRVIVLSYVLALFVSRLLAALGRWAIAPFFSQVIAGATVTLAAAGMAQLSQHQVQFFAGMNPTLIVVSGIIMLVAGLAFVSAVQDAIEEYYLTATARLMRAIMMTAGIVMGIIIGLYAARKLSIGITVSPNPLQLMQLHYQVIGGAAASAAYALATQTRLRAILWAGLLGGGSLSIMYAATHLGIASVPATGVAAIVVGLAAALFSRLWRTPSSGIISVAILPLVPGLTLYTGLMQLVNYPPGHPLFFRGVGTLFTAVATALAIAAGASFGYVLGRPLHRQITHRRNLTPVANFMRRQLHSDRQISKFGRLALRRANRDPERLS